MTTVLFADNDYPDIALEPRFSRAAGVELKLAPMQDRGRRDRAGKGCSAILPQYAPIRRASLDALPSTRHREPHRRGLRQRRHRGLRAARRLGRELARLRRRRSGDARAGAGARVDAQRRRLPPRHPRGHLALHVVGRVMRRPTDMTLGIVGPRTHRQADGAHLAQRVQARHRLRPLPDRRRLSRVCRARRTLAELAAQCRRRVAAHAAQCGDARA